MNKEILISDDKSLFLDFLENDYSGKVLNLLDDDGINLLKNYKYKEERICYLLAYSKYIDELIKNSKFLNLFLNSKINYYYASLKKLLPQSYDLMIKGAIEQGKSIEFVAELFSYFNSDYKLKKLDNWEYGDDLLYKIFKKDTKFLGPKIIKNFNINLDSHDIDLQKIFDIGRTLYFENSDNINKGNEKIQTFDIPDYMISKDIAKKLWNKNNIFKYRRIINDASYCCNSELLNEYAKEVEDSFVKNISGNLVSPYDELYYILNKMDSNCTDDEYDKLYILRCNILNNLDPYSLNLINENINDKNKLYEKLCKLSSRKLSNYIIDYHFEENYYNIMYDLKELLNFYYNGNINLSEEKLELYVKVYNIDFLNIDEQIELHETLKKYNMIEMFYDDMSFARNIVRQSILDSSLTKEEMLKYKDESLSKKYGVNVYNISGDPFFAIVKSHIRAKDEFPTGHSYSMVGNGCVAVWGDLEDSDTFVYDSSNVASKQIVHVFPRDSFTFYRPFIGQNSNITSRVNKLIMPDELLNESNAYYNEILILESGTKETDMDKDIRKLERIALYCVDKITEKDVQVAQSHGIGIFLINSKDYIKESKNDNYYFDNNYFDGYADLEKHEISRSL